MGCGRTNELLGGGGAEVTDPEMEDRIVRTVGGGRARHCRRCERPTNVNHRVRAAASAVTTELSPRPSGMTRRLWQFGNSEQHGGVLQGMQGVRCLGNDQQVTVAPFPRHAVSDQPHPTMQHLHGGFAGVLVF